MFPKCHATFLAKFRWSITLQTRVSVLAQLSGRLSTRKLYPSAFHQHAVARRPAIHHRAAKR